ncbi:MAG: AbrB/MazE/SpoVT family DNA-binding domain-containing protein [Candidatus Paceibacterota bacterium]
MAQNNTIQFVRKTIRLGGGLYINIPAEIVNVLSIREKQKLTVELDGDNIVVKDWEK